MQQKTSDAKPGCFEGTYSNLVLRARMTGGKIKLDRGIAVHPQDKVFVDPAGIIYTVRRTNGITKAVGVCELLPIPMRGAR